MANNVTLNQNVMSKINDNGRIVIPAQIREEMRIKPGDTLFLRVEGDVLMIESQRTRIRRIQEEFRRFAKPGVLASDELIAERREEARREMEEWHG